jgi:hypothetical protein
MNERLKEKLLELSVGVIVGDRITGVRKEMMYGKGGALQFERSMYYFLIIGEGHADLEISREDYNKTVSFLKAQCDKEA